MSINRSSQRPFLFLFFAPVAALFSVRCVRRCSASLLTHTHRASLRSVCSMCEVFFYIFLFALLFSLGCFLSLYIDYFWVFVSPVHFIRMSKKSLKPATVSFPHFRAGRGLVFGPLHQALFCFVAHSHTSSFVAVSLF